LKSNIYVISCQRNAGRFAIKCLDSVQKQSIEVKKHFYVDAASDDGTQDVVRNWLQKSDPQNVQYIENPTRTFKNENMHRIISEIDDDEGIIAIVDGDDWLHSSMSLEIVSKEYEKDSGLEYVYSNWMFSHNKEFGISKPISNQDWNPYRDPWITSHLTTFKVKSYKRVPTSNFLNDNGAFFETGGDQACNLPILMSLKLRDGDYRTVKHIPLPLYVYQYAEGNHNLRTGIEGREYLRFESETVRFIRQRGFLKE